jgi:hypothetical protein
MVCVKLNWGWSVEMNILIFFRGITPKQIKGIIGKMKSDLYFVKVIIPHKKDECQTLYKISSGKHFVIHQHGNWIYIVLLLSVLVHWINSQ